MQRKSFVGNDIVDLGDETAGRHPRFARRVLSDIEYNQFASHRNSNVYLFKAWAAKEAVYKMLKQKKSNVGFSPCRYVFDEFKNEVTFENIVINVNFRETDQYIFCWCVEGTELVSHRIEISSEWNQSNAVRRLAREYLAKVFSVKISEIKIVLDEFKIPLAYCGDNILPVSMSFSHHGQFVSISIA